MRRMRTAISAALLLATAVLAAAPIAGRAATGDGRIYVQRGVYIYAADADGGNVHQLTHTGTSTMPDTEATVSPDGRQLAYVVNSRYIYVLPVTGGAPRRVADGTKADYPTWSPDGRRIAFQEQSNCYQPDVVNGGGNFEKIFGITINAVASGKNVATAEACTDGYYMPAWSPDGKTLLLSTDDYYKKGGKNYSYLGLFTSPFGKGKRGFLTHSDHVRDYDYVLGAWSPDGRRIACVRVPRGQKGGGGALWLLNRDSSGGHALVASVDQARPAWSPDGSMLAYSTAGAVYTVPAAGGVPMLVLRGGSNPAWGR